MLHILIVCICQHELVGTNVLFGLWLAAPAADGGKIGIIGAADHRLVLRGGSDEGDHGLQPLPEVHPGAIRGYSDNIIAKCNGWVG